MEQNVGKVIHRFSTTFPREIVEETYCGLIFFIKISPAAESALGDAYAHLNQLDKAVDAFKKAASMADSKADDGLHHVCG